GLLLPAAPYLAPSLAWSAAARIASARLWPAQEYTRVIIEGPAPIAHQLRTLTDPHRVVLDLEGVADAPELDQLPFRLQSSDPYIAGMRIGVASPDVERIDFELMPETLPKPFAFA